MSSTGKEETAEAVLIDEPQVFFQEIQEEMAALQQQRVQISDQRALLDLERIELEQRLSALQLSYALLDAHTARIDRREVMLDSEHEFIQMMSKRLRRLR